MQAGTAGDEVPKHGVVCRTESKPAALDADEAVILQLQDICRIPRFPQALEDDNALADIAGG